MPSFYTVWACYTVVAVSAVWPKAVSALFLSWLGSRSPDFAISMMRLATASLPGFIKVLTGGLERFAHGFCRVVIKH